MSRYYIIYIMDLCLHKGFQNNSPPIRDNEIKIMQILWGTEFPTNHTKFSLNGFWWMKFKDLMKQHATRKQAVQLLMK